MKTISAADIHGVTPELRSMIGHAVGEAVFLSPWENDLCPFANEQEAASVFISQNGIATYATKIALTANREPAFIIGFSVGASAAWLHSASEDCNPESVATLFYGSRIRDYSSLAPKFRITAIFAETEPSFSPGRVVQAIARDNVHAYVEPGTLHGFMNPNSANFVPALCSVHLRKLAVAREQLGCHAAHR